MKPYPRLNLPNLHPKPRGQGSTRHSFGNSAKLGELDYDNLWSNSWFLFLHICVDDRVSHCEKQPTRRTWRITEVYNRKPNRSKGGYNFKNMKIIEIPEKHEDIDVSIWREGTTEHSSKTIKQWIITLESNNRETND
jgi:hypothetical protein